MKYLVVDDSDIDRRLNVAIIRSLNPNSIVCQASDGIEGLNLFKSELDFDIVITDFSMPNMNGVEMVKQIKLVSSEIKTVCVSSTDESKIENVFDVILSKPTNKEKYLQTIEKLT